MDCSINILLSIDAGSRAGLAKNYNEYATILELILFIGCRENHELKFICFRQLNIHAKKSLKATEFGAYTQELLRQHLARQTLNARA